MAKEFDKGIHQALYVATPPLEAFRPLTVKLAAREGERKDTRTAPGDDNSSIMIHVDVHRAHSSAQAKPNIHVKVSEEDQTEEGKVRGCLVKAMHGT